MPRAEQLTDPDAEHGEGPVWSLSWGGLRWVDMSVGDILHLDEDTGAVDRWHVGKVAAAFRPRAPGGMVIAAEREFLLADLPGGPLRGLGTVFPDPEVRFNDGATDPAGNFLCGTMAYNGAEGRGTLYRLRPSGEVDVVWTPVTVSNGLAWTVDGSLAYYADTNTQRVDVADSDAEGNLTNRRPFVRIDPADGSPDGLTVDAEGGVWVALWNGSAVRHYDADGTLQEVIDLPMPKVTACTFGGQDLNELFITTSRQDEKIGENPLAGAIFRYRPGVTGQPALTFAG